MKPRSKAVPARSHQVGAGLFAFQGNTMPRKRSRARKAKGATPSSPKGRPEPAPIVDRPLAPAQRRFVDELPAAGWDYTEAARRAGYSPRTAKQQGHRLMQDPRIAAAAEAKRAELAERSLTTAERVLEELATIGLADMRDYVSFTGAGEMVLAFDHMPEKASRAIAEVTQKRYLVGKDDGARWVTETKFKLHPKTPALNLIAQHLGMLVQKHQHQQLDRNGKPVDPPKELRVTFVRPPERAA